MDKTIELSFDFRSDTVTHPTLEMRQAMFDAEVADDVIGEDPTVIKLEKLAACLLGKEAGLFVASGTMGNQCAIMTHTKPGNEVIVADRCHIVQHEAGAAARLSQVQLRTVSHGRSNLDAQDILPVLRIQKDIHYPDTGLICVEQATGDGTVMPLKTLQAIKALASQHNIPVHMDGARIFNAATHLGCNPKQIADCVDSVTFCLSKGLCAPIGSLMVGKQTFIERARMNRKILGGGMRQSGFMAAAGLVAVQEMPKQLAATHKNARYLRDKLDSELGIKTVRPVDISMVFINANTFKTPINNMIATLADKGIRIFPPEHGELRFVTHHYTTEAAIDCLVKELAAFC